MAQYNNQTAKKFTQGADSGASDGTYNLVSLLYHTLKGSAHYERYLKDAEEAGDQELIQFLQDCEQQDRLRAQRSKELLRHRLVKAEARHDAIDERAMESFPASDPPAH